MKHLLYAILVLFMVSCGNKQAFEAKTGTLSMSIDHSGRITSLKDVAKDVDYIAQEPSYLLLCSRYGTKDKLDAPISASMKSENLLELTYPGNVKLTVSIEPKGNYFKMKLVEADPVAEISFIKWGPYYTNMQSFIGPWVGLVRSDDFSIGLMSLDPNTDYPGNRPSSAHYTKEGASLELFSFDHTRGVFRDYLKLGAEDSLRRATPIPVTVKGSTVALYGSKAGYDNELDEIEKIELSEGLPHPTIDGVWNKRSRQQVRSCLWSWYKEDDFDEYLDLAEEIGAGIFCNPAGYFKNWGHFEIDLKKYPGGLEKMKEMNQRAHKKGIGTTIYTLTTFTKPITEAEPFVGPIPDDRLQTWRYQSKVVKAVKPNETTILIKSDKNILETAKKSKQLRIDNELISFDQFKEEDGNLRLSDCKRGLFFTEPQPHDKDADVKFMYLAGYRNFYPATNDMALEMADNIYRSLAATDQTMLVTDGFESCVETGYTSLTGNLFYDRIYKHYKQDNRDVYQNGSLFSNYTWHHTAFISWGEYDLGHGFRGSMLDYRLNNQVALGTSLMPKKMGQYYPDHASIPDMEWLIGIATGWDSGIDFVMSLNGFKKNPNYNALVKKMGLWAQARKEKAFTEEQLRNLRQTDREYQLSKNNDGTWNLDFVKFWQYDKLKLLPAESLPVKSLSGDVVKPRSIDWFWTHNPGTYDEVQLSDDMIHASGEQPSSWEVSYPDYKEPANAYYPIDLRYFQYVIRLPEDAPCAVESINLSFNGYEIHLPVTLKPGDYLTMPHLITQLCVYDKKHKLVQEKMLRGIIPSVKKGEKATIKIACTPVVKGEKPSLIMNVRNQNGFFFNCNSFE